MWRAFAVAVIFETLAASSPVQAVEPGTPPSCAISGGSFVCTADLDGLGKQSIIVGNTTGFNLIANGNPNAGPFSYVMILNNNGAVRREICWAAGTNQTAVPCPIIKSVGAVP
jgi:hypothetical protein